MTAISVSDPTLERVAQLLNERLGLRPESTLRGRLGRCVRDALTARGELLDAYIDSLRRDGDALQDLLDRVTVQETAFFRHPEQFDALTSCVLPTLSRPLAIWSAACATGQEAYSLAMLLEEQGLDGTVLATDISRTALDRAAAARYRTRELTGLSSERRARHLIPAGSDWLVRDAIRDRVTVMQHNLTGPVPVEVGQCQVVFCRNVLIYFSPEHAARFLERLADRLVPGAVMFLGSAESIWHVTDRFEPLRVGETFIYRRRGSGNKRVSPSVTVGQTPSATPKPLSARPPRAVGRAASSPPTHEVVAVEKRVLAIARSGQDAHAAGDHLAAIAAFRQWVYLEPDDGMAHLHLGLAFEAAGDWSSARRAFNAARSALLAGDPAAIASSLGGYQVGDALTLLDRKAVTSP